MAEALARLAPTRWVACLPAAMLVLPTLNIPTSFYMTPFLLLGLYCMSREGFFPHQVQLLKRFAVIAAGFVFAAASAAWSRHPELVFDAVKSNILNPLFVFCVLSYFYSRQPPEMGRSALLVAAVPLFVLSPVGYALYGRKFTEVWFYGIGYYSTYIAICAPVLVPFLSARYRALFYVMLAACVWWSWQRIGWLLLPLIAGADYLVNGARRSRWGLLLFLAAAVLTSLAALKALQFMRPAGGLDPHLQSHGVLDYLLADPRLRLWWEWAGRGLDHWLAGVGFGRDTALETFSGGGPWSSRLLRHGHNVFINTFVQLGAIGLLLLLAGYASIFRFLMRAGRSPVASAGLLLLSFYLLRSVVDDYEYKRVLVFYWGMLGVIVGLLWQQERKPEAAAGAGSPSPG